MATEEKKAEEVKKPDAAPQSPQEEEKIRLERIKKAAQGKK